MYFLINFKLFSKTIGMHTASCDHVVLVMLNPTFVKAATYNLGWEEIFQH